jgi:hypothetical protein
MSSEYNSSIAFLTTLALLLPLPSSAKPFNQGSNQNPANLNSTYNIPSAHFHHWVCEH